MYKILIESLKHFPKTSRYTLGEKIESLLIETLEFILIAQYLNRSEKVQYVRKATAKLDVMKFFVQVAWETKVLDNKKFVVFLEKSSEIGRMLNGWAKQLAKENPAS